MRLRLDLLVDNHKRTQTECLAVLADALARVAREVDDYRTGRRTMPDNTETPLLDQSFIKIGKLVLSKHA